MSGHTPGPWRVGVPDIRCVLEHGGELHGRGKCEYTLQGWHDDDGFTNGYVSSEATNKELIVPDEYDNRLSVEDTRLIAAAPDLLDAAKLTVLHFQRNQVSGNFQGDDEHEAWTALDKAIAKAEGRS